MDVTKAENRPCAQSMERVFGKNTWFFKFIISNKQIVIFIIFLIIFFLIYSYFCNFFYLFSFLLFQIF